MDEPPVLSSHLEVKLGSHEFQPIVHFVISLHILKKIELLSTFFSKKIQTIKYAASLHFFNLLDMAQKSK